MEAASSTRQALGTVVSAIDDPSQRAAGGTRASVQQCCDDLSTRHAPNHCALAVRPTAGAQDVWVGTSCVDASARKVTFLRNYVQQGWSFLTDRQPSLLALADACFSRRSDQQRLLSSRSRGGLRTVCNFHGLRFAQHV